MIDQHDSLWEKFLRKWFWLYLFSFLAAPLWYIIKIIISWDLRVEEIWIIYGVMSLMILLSSFNDFWMTESLNKFIPEYVTHKKYDRVKTILSYAFAVQMTTGILIFFIFFLGAEFLSLHYFKDAASLEVIQIFAVFFLWINIFQIMNTLFQATQDTFNQKITEFLRMFFVVIATVMIFFLDMWNIIHYSFAWIVGLFFGIWISFVIFWKKYYLPYLKNVEILYDKKLFLSILKYAFLVFLWSQVTVILSQIDMQMIIYMLGNRDAWFYTNYLSIIGIPFILIGPIFGMMFPIFSEMYAKKEFDKIQLVKSIFSKTFLSFSIVFSVLFFVFWPQIAFILFGEKFIFSGEILQWSILFLSFLFIFQINLCIFAATGKIITRFYIMLFGLGFNILTNIIFISLYWVVWAALATGIGWLVLWGISEYFVKEYNGSYDIVYLLKNSIIFGGIWALLWMFVLPSFAWLSRGIAFWYFCGISLMYFLIYVLINKKDFLYFWSEVRKLRNKKTVK